MLALDPHRLLPSKPDPCEILENCRDEFRPAPAFIGVLDAEKKPATACRCHTGIEQG
jgi:hypothetical protein